jgi:broad specificity phosphatase PhoE
MNLLIVRHAESMGNATGDYSSSVSDALSPKGEEQALALGKSLKSMRFDRVLASPRQRAMQTVTPYLKCTNRSAEIWPELAEACWHPEREDPTKSWDSQPTPLPSGMADLFEYRDDMAISPAHPESFGSGLRRVHDTMELLHDMGDTTDATLLIVTHGHFIRELLNIMLDTRRLNEFPHDNCGMTSVTFDTEWTLQFCNRVGK